MSVADILKQSLDNLQLEPSVEPLTVLEQFKPRVRQILPGLCYSDLVRLGIIPDLVNATKQTPTKRYPPWIYRRAKEDDNTFSKFGLFMEEIVVKAISSDLDKVTDQQLTESWMDVFGETPPSDLFSSRNFFGGIYSTFRPAFEGMRNIKHEPELSCEFFTGHPDLYNSWILDVKTTGNFSKMIEESSLQILAYSALARNMGDDGNFIGILLPLQREILWYDVSKWDSSQFLQIMIQHSQWTTEDLINTDPILSMNRVQALHPKDLKPKGYMSVFGYPRIVVTSEHLGSHWHKNDPFPTDIPIQIYLAGRQAGQDQGYLSEPEIVELAQRCQNITTYIHAPNNINLSSPDSWIKDRVIDQLRVGQRLGALGVVVHVGKRKTNPILVARERMLNNLKDCLDSVDESCPLLIETPAGQNGELLPTIEELSKFYMEFSKEEQKLIKICIDTCHVFSAGYDPSYYLETWLSKHPNSVELVHFNDSKKHRGCRVDRHHPAGTGHIGYERLWRVHQLCVKHNIDMVYE